MCCSHSTVQYSTVQYVMSMTVYSNGMIGGYRALVQCTRYHQSPPETQQYPDTICGYVVLKWTVLKLRALLQLLQNFPCSQESQETWCGSAGGAGLGWRWLELWLRHRSTGAVVAGRAALASWTLHGTLTHQSSQPQHGGHTSLAPPATPRL